MSVLRKLLTLFTGTPDILGRRVHVITERDLISEENQIGKQLFGVLPTGHVRDFFCLDKTTWVWHEAWLDNKSGQTKEITTRYEIQPGGILKVQTGREYKYVEGVELQNLAIAIRLYYERTMRSVYHYDPYTGIAI
ncbi:hypothetical protein EOL73_01685 [Candidatus Saccharibacteria bacterium]|nr:hypothetical protein [Candidatus Saccharibacteria bacterium]NCU40448.1 hypothetical protein [Candidatus Saccharibacteria bacterium]